MALYTESDDWQKFAREQMRNSAQNLQQKQAGLDAAKNQKTQTSLVSALTGLVNGIKERGSDILNTVKNIEKTKYGWLDEIIANNDLKNTQKDDSARRNEIAKKYGFNSYSEAINSDRAGDNFWNEIKASNEQTKSRLKKNTDAYRNSITDVTKVNTNEAKGQALNTIDSVLGLIPGVGGVVANVAGGGISGVGDEYKAAGREGRDVDWSNAGKNALIGAASGLAGSAGSAGLGKVATKFGGNAVGKALGSNLASGVAGGASAGAVGGALGTALNGGTLEDALLAAKEGAKAGAIGGGTMASVMGLGGTALDKIRNRGTVTPQTIEPADAQIVAKNKIQAPQTKAIEAEIVEPVNNRRGIAIKDLNAGVEEIPVKTVVGTPSRGKYIDSVVDRAKANLPESKKTAAQILYDTTNGEYSNAAEMLAGKTAADSGQFGGYANEALADYFPKDLVTAIRNGAREIYGEQTPFDAYGLNSREGLPLLNRQEYYNDRTGKPGVSIVSEDIPAYMQDRMRNDAGKGRYSSSDNESIMREVFGDNMDKEQMYDLYEQLAQTTIDPRIYSDDNLGAALAIDPELNRRATQILADQTRKNIAVQGGPSISDAIPVADRTTRYTENTLPARTYEQPTARANKVMNAEPTATKASPTTAQIAPEQRITTPEPELDYHTQVQRQKAQIAADKAKRQAIGGVIEQYGTTRLSDRIEGLPTAIEDMLDLGLTDRAEIELFSKKLASGDSEISKAIRKSLNDATPIDGKWGFTWEDVFNAAGAANNEAAQKQIKSFYESQAKKLLRADENGQFNRNDVYNFGKALEKEGYKKYDRGVRNQNTNTQVYGEALINMSQDIIGKATDGVDVSGKFNTNKLKNLLPGNEAWAAKVDALNTNAKTVQDLRSAMASATKMNLLKQAEEYNMNTYGQNVGGKGKGSAAVKASKGLITGNPMQVAEAGAEIVLGSDKAKQKAIKKSYENYKKYQAQANGEAPIKTGKIAGMKEKIADIKDAGIVQGAKNLGNNLVERVNKNLAPLNNDSLAGINGIRVGKNYTPIEFNALGNQAQQFTNKQIGSQEANRAQDRLENARTLANAQNEYDNALADYNAQEANYNAQMAQSQGSNGAANMLDRINRAMELAMQAGDITAYSQLADLYKQAYSIYEMQNPQTKNEGKALSASQSKALAAQQQLDELVGMTPDAGTVASSIPIAKNIVKLTGGNEYANQADALANTLGYLLSGANIKKEELEGIYRDYVPTAFDSEAVRQQKLDRARQLIQSYMSDTGALEA